MSNLPFLIVSGSGTVPCRQDYLGLCTELSLLAVTQYAGFNFDSMCKLGDVYLGCNARGIFELDGSTDEGMDIDAFFELPTTDFGLSKQKRIRKVYLGYEASGSLVLEVKDDEDNVRKYTLEAALSDNREHSAKIPVGRDGKGRYWSFKIENVAGCDFSVDSIDASIVILGKKSGKTMTNSASLVIPIFEIDVVGSVSG